MDNICKLHNEPALYCEQNAGEQMIFFCRICMEYKYQIYNKDEFDNQQKQVLQQLELNYDQKLKQLKDFADKLQQYSQNIQQKLNIIKQQVEQNISHIIEKQLKIKNISQSFNNLQINQINEEENVLNYQLIKIKEQLINQLKDFEMSIQIDQLFSSLNNLQIDLNKKELEQQKFNYKLIQQSTYKQNEFCRALAFNKEATIMIAGCNYLIKVFEFKEDKINLVQQLNGHQQDVCCLQFMKKSDQFISGSDDSTMIIWEYNNNNNSWWSIKVLKGHSDYINCITLNKNEDMLISGSWDNSIKFWQIQNNTWNSIQSIDFQNPVLSISLSDKEDKLIASLNNNQILILQLQGKEWITKQKILVHQYGWRLCFINQDQFVFQPKDGDHLLIFDYNSKEQTFQKVQELQYLNKGVDNYALFPIQYIPQIELIMVNHCDNVHLIKRSQDGQFKLEQSIKFSADRLYGSISDDGRYLTTWDDKSQEIQIRKYDY